VLVTVIGLLAGPGPVIGAAVLADRLPDRAITLGGGGSAAWELAIGIPSVVVLALSAGVATYLLRRPRLVRRSAIGVALGGVVLVGGQVAALLVDNLDPEPLPGWASPPAVLAAAVLVGALARWAAGTDPGLPAATAGPGPAAPRMPMRAGERAVWIRSVLCVRRLWHAAGWVGLAALTFMVNGNLPVVYLAPFALVFAIQVAQVWARVRVDRRGVWVEQPLLRRTLVGVDLANVQEAVAEVAEPWSLPRAFGVLSSDRVWGFRATRGGELLRLTTTDGRDFVVTVPDARTAAALVNTELDRRGVSTC
jgi:hypothetical protein